MENISNFILKEVKIDTKEIAEKSIATDRLFCNMSLYYNFSKEIKEISFKVIVRNNQDITLFTIASDYTFEHKGDIEDNEALANKLSVYIKPKLEQLISYVGVEIGMEEN